jgi:hypothetical protein
MSNPINRVAVCSAFGLAGDHCTADVFKRLVSAGLIPAPLDAGYDSFDLSAVQALLGGAAATASYARKVVTEHRGGSKAVV